MTQSVVVKKPTPVQLELLERLSRGLTYKQAALERGVSEATIKNTAWELKRRIQAETMPHAMVIAMRKGWIR